MSSFTQSIFLLCVLTLLSTQNTLGVRVSVLNNLEQNLDLTIHCKSADNDLGVHLLHHGESFGWNFKISLIGHTLYYCSFEWNGGFHYYDIYIASRDYNVCDPCNWYITKSGPCRVLAAGSAVCDFWKK
ncbi:unnamed protein product [Lathyrus oleraceus]